MKLFFGAIYLVSGLFLGAFICSWSYQDMNQKMYIAGCSDTMTQIARKGNVQIPGWVINEFCKNEYALRK